jgi:hypothetical protein
LGLGQVFPKVDILTKDVVDGVPVDEIILKADGFAQVLFMMFYVLTQR